MSGGQLALPASKDAADDGLEREQHRGHEHTTEDTWARHELEVHGDRGSVAVGLDRPSPSHGVQRIRIVRGVDVDRELPALVPERARLVPAPPERVIAAALHPGTLPAEHFNPREIGCEPSVQVVVGEQGPHV